MYTINGLLAAIAAGETFEYLHFWGHRPAADGSVNKSCFSQWYARGFTYDDEYFPTAEHWMMAGKARLFGDEKARAQIFRDDSPHAAKKLGRKVSNFDKATWEEHCFQLVVAGNYHKFSQSAPLRAYLLQTGDKVLVEASPYDAIWGIGMAEQDPRANDPQQWMGTNWLGFALMEVRDKLRKEINKKP
ncbi:MAG: NADAR family protein [Bacteroidota bacterium]